MTPGRRAAGALAASALLLASSPASAAPAPTVSIWNLRDLPTPLPLPFEARADARAAVAQAQARAAAGHKLLLIEMGANWCADCRLLAAVMDLPEVAAFVAAHYEVVEVDVGHLDRNLDIPARYGVKRPDAVPSLIVADGGGRVIDAGETQALSDARAMRPQDLADWLARWTR